MAALDFQPAARGPPSHVDVVQASSSHAAPGLQRQTTPSQVCASAPSPPTVNALESAASVTAQSPEKVRARRVAADAKLLEAERDAEAQLHMCRALSQALSAVAEVLLSAGAGLQRESSSSSSSCESSAVHQLSGGEKALQGACHFNATISGEEPLSDRACRGLLVACTGLGVELVRLASTLTGDVVVPIRDMQRMLEADWERQKIELAQLEQYEVMCSSAVQESATRKNKASLELQERVRERDIKGKPTSKRALKWLLKPGFGKAAGTESKVEHAAHAQTAAVEDLAARMDQVATARFRRDECAEELRRLYLKVAARRREVLRFSLKHCASAWGRLAESLGVTAKQLLGDALKLEVHPDVSGCDSHLESSPQLPRLLTTWAPAENATTANSSIAVEARRRVPRLPLAELARTAPPAPPPWLPASASGPSSSSCSATSVISSPRFGGGESNARNDPVPSAVPAAEDLRRVAMDDGDGAAEVVAALGTFVHGGDDDSDAGDSFVSEAISPVSLASPSGDIAPPARVGR